MKHQKEESIYGHPIARQFEKWWKDHYERHDKEGWIKWTEIYTALLAEKMKEFTTEHVNEIDGKKVFGMSKASGCTKEAGLKALGHKGEPFSGSSAFTFVTGHLLEVAALATLSAIGYDLETQVPVDLYAKDGEPLASSKADARTKMLGIPTNVSVKSTAYKMSGIRWTKGKQTITRRGFAELPFGGVRNLQPSWYTQAQAEMMADGTKQTLFLVVSKDIVKAFEDDEYLGDRGNGSLAFYAEVCKYEPEIAELVVKTLSEQKASISAGHPGKPMYMTNAYQYVRLNEASYVKGNIWGGPNKELTGTFNPCGGCAMIEVCKVVPS